MRYWEEGTFAGLGVRLAGGIGLKLAKHVGGAQKEISNEYSLVRGGSLLASAEMSVFCQQQRKVGLTRLIIS